VGVIGLGYVGLPLAVNATERGLRAIGFDRSQDVVRRLARGESTVGDIPEPRLRAALASGLTVTYEETELKQVDAIFVCVPSPLTRHRQPDMSFIEAAAETVARVTHPGLLVSLESTTYPGTTEEMMIPAATADGLELDRDVYVCFSPERVDPGSGLTIGSIPKVVGGVTPASGTVAEAAYSRMFDRVHRVSSARVAEMSKLLENTFRAVNIGLVNELAQLAHALEIDIWEVVGAAATKPFGFLPFYPGPGVGGHCIPLDPQYLAWRAKAAGVATRFIDLADEVNSRMPGYTTARIMDLLNDNGLPLRGTEILAVGLAYKPNVEDARESPAIEVVNDLVRRGARVRVWDPMLPAASIEALGVPSASGPGVSTQLAVVLTDHDCFDLDALARSVPLVFDARGAYVRRGLTATNVHSL
jgi:UDP-N-acetyl-D-glucosamine dehydrogenase